MASLKRYPGLWIFKPSALTLNTECGTVKFPKAKQQKDGSMPEKDLVLLFSGHKSYIFPDDVIDGKFRLIRKWKTTDAPPVMAPDCVEGF